MSKEITLNSPPKKIFSLQRIIVMTILIAAGEAVFLLPFVVPRIFRPTVLEVFGINNLQLGVAFSLYGFIAMVAYFAGGPLADRFSARRLMTVALLTTSAGGILLANNPSLNTLTLLYGFWGLTTILLFWAALIRATREWGGADGQGQAYGILDGGRGLFAALLASISVVIFDSLLPTNVSAATLLQKGEALKYIIWIFTGIVLVTAVLVWIFIPENKTKPEAGFNKPMALLSGMGNLFRRPTIWLQAIIVLCAYVGYKCTDDFSLYAYDAFGYDDVEAAKIGTVSFWMRPIAAIGAGILGDRLSSSKVILTSFGILAVGSLIIALGMIPPGIFLFLIFIIAGTSLAIYALRGVYFALFEESKIPLALTGSAVGLVSVIGYTPDIFMGPVMGYLIDSSPGALGHQYVFGVLTAFAIIGLIATLIFRRITRKQ